MSDLERRQEVLRYMDSVGDFLELGYFEATDQNWANRPLCTEDWDRYLIYDPQGDQQLAMCFAYNDDRAREFADCAGSRRP